jgi:hypothetical protein
MTATAAPYGAQPVENLAAGYDTEGFETLTIADAYATAIYMGDFVKLASTGVIQKDTGTTTLTPIGVFLGVRYISPTLGYVLDDQYWPASLSTGNTVQAKVATNPNIVMAMQADGSVALSDIGANAAVVQTAGDAYSKRSRNALQASSINTSGTLPLRIVNLVQTPDNAWGDSYTNVLVKFNAGHQYNNTTGV